jgi:hypothetical protein
MNNERNNRLILDNIPLNSNTYNLTNQLNEEPENKSKQKNDNNLINKSHKENKFQD